MLQVRASMPTVQSLQNSIYNIKNKTIMLIPFKAEIVKIENWSNSESKKDITVIEEKSKEEIIVLCLKENFDLLKKCKKGKKMKLYANLKACDYGVFKRNYLILEHIAPVIKK